MYLHITLESLNLQKPAITEIKNFKKTGKNKRHLKSYNSNHNRIVPSLCIVAVEHNK